MPRKDPRRDDRGPKLNEDVCITEDVKIGIHLAVERFRLDDTKEELAFPCSLNATERAYIHRWSESLGGLKSRSRGSGQNRFITLTKVTSTQGKWTPDYLHLSKSDIGHIGHLLQRFPISDKEREDLMPITEKKASSAQEFVREKIAFGRLVNTPAQIPPKKSHSDLSRFRETLPVYQMGAEIIETIENNQVCLVAGETGSGKTTQVPQLIMDNCYEKKQPCRILCTQPRRIAAISIAERVAAERGERLGNAVGYQIRLESKVSPKTVLTFCTAGVVLRSMMGKDSHLGTVTHILVDEVHERDKFVDFLLLCLKEALPKHPNLKIILMSATLNMEVFSSYFNMCPIVCVPGSLHPVEEYFLEDVLKWTDFKTPAMKKLLDAHNSLKKVEDNLAEWFSKQVDVTEDALDSDFEDDSELTTSDAIEEVGEEKENLDPAVKKELDHLLQEIWLTGNKDLFHKVLHLISSENVSVDYAQSDSSATALMIAAGRGFVDMVEHLLNLGASVNARTINDWTALDFAKQFDQQAVVQLLEAFALAAESNLVSVQDEDLDLISPEERLLLTAYQHSFDDEKVDVALLKNLIFKIHHSCDEGAILVFLPGYDDMTNLHMQISEDQRFSSKRHNFIIYTLHSSIQASDQKKVFKVPPRGVRKIILSTNIAETSVTINDVVYVIDAGKVKEKTFDALSNFTMLKSNWISKASALQRKGRAGRCQPGTCYHLFSRGRYMHLQDFPTPEILRLPLQELCLQTKLLAPKTESIADFIGRCPEAPPPLVIHNAVQTLKEIDALDPFEELTELGQHLADLPVEPRLGKMLLYSIVLRCLDPVLTIVCTLSHKEPFVLPSLPSQRKGVMMTRRKFAEQTYSDHFVLLRAFQLWQKARVEGWELAFCEKNSISSANMQMLVGMRMQLLTQLKALGFLRGQGQGGLRDLNMNADNWAVVKACLVAGTYPNILQRKELAWSLSTRKETKVCFHTSSVLSPPLSANKAKSDKVLKKAVKDLPSRWLIFEEMSRIGRHSQARCCSLVSCLSVFLFAGPSKVKPDALKQKTECADEDDSHEEENICVFRPDDWLTFHCNSGEASAALDLRTKFNSLFLNRMRHPQKSWTQLDEALLRVITTALSNAEACLGLANPVGVGQKPRSMVNEAMLGGAMMEELYGNVAHQHQPQHGWGAQQNYGRNRPPSQQSSHSHSGRKPRDHQEHGQGVESCYFIMKSATHKLLEISQTKNLWSTSTGHEGKLSKAFNSGRSVYLIFSVQGSGHFQGYARMTSSVARMKSPDFPSPGISAVFAVEWVKSAHLPFQLSHHLLNPWNENKKVQESRDGQELEPKVGAELVRLWDKFHHQLKPFKVGPPQRQQRPEEQGATARSQKSSYSKSSQGQKSHSKSKDKAGKSQSGKQGEGEPRLKQEASVDSNVSSPPLSVSSNEESSGSSSSPSDRRGQVRQPSTESSHSESSSQGLLGEPPGGLMPLPLQLHGQHGAGAGNASLPVFYGNLQQQQQQQNLAYAQQQSYVGGGMNPYLLSQGGLLGQGYMVRPQASPMMMMQQQRGQPPQQHHHQGGRQQPP